MSNCVNWVDEIHYQQKQVYLWSGNCLRKISDLDDEELKDVRDLLNSEAQNRGV